MELTPSQLATILASGKYKKAHGSLHINRGEDGYCCLGVYAVEARLMKAEDRVCAGSNIDIPDQLCPDWMLKKPPATWIDIHGPYSTVKSLLIDVNDKTWLSWDDNEGIIEILNSLEPSFDYGQQGY